MIKSDSRYNINFTDIEQFQPLLLIWSGFFYELQYLVNQCKMRLTSFSHLEETFSDQTSLLPIYAFKAVRGLDIFNFHD